MSDAASQRSVHLPVGPRGLPVASEERIQHHLLETSRTFALAIPLLPRPTMQEVSIAYLLFRIADTFEDASVPWSRARQIRALGDFADLLDEADPVRVETLVDAWLEPPRPTVHQGYLELLADVPAVLGAVGELAPAARRSIAHHTRRTAEGMASIVARTGEDGLLELANVAELREYCYIVAGIVGEMLTELFLLGSPSLAGVADELRRRAAVFGEALQLVNVLKDSADDREEGRRYLPAGVERAEIFRLARRDIEVAGEYVRTVQAAGGPDGLVRFTGLPVLLARATLDRVEEKGPGSKISRSRVYRLRRRMERAIERGEPAVPAAGPS